MPFNLESLLSKQSKIGQSRSSVLNPLQWMTVIIVGGLASFVYVSAAQWLIILMAVLLSSTFALFAGAFIYFMIREPGTLRSEDYSLAKHALDKGLFTPEIANRVLFREKKIKAGQSIEVKDVKELKETVGRGRRSRPLAADAGEPQ